MTILYVWLGFIIVMVIGFVIAGIEEDKDIWQSAVGNYKHKREQKKRDKHEWRK